MKQMCLSVHVPVSRVQLLVGQNLQQVEQQCREMPSDIADLPTSVTPEGIKLNTTVNLIDSRKDNLTSASVFALQLLAKIQSYKQKSPHDDVILNFLTFSKSCIISLYNDNNEFQIRHFLSLNDQPG